MPTENELFNAVDALLEQVAQDDLPPPAERRRLREAAGLSQAEIAQALDTRREAVGNWESGRSEPRQPKRAAYVRLLEGLAARYPAEPEAAPTSDVTRVLGGLTGPAPAAVVDQQQVEAPAPTPVAMSRPVESSARPSSRRPRAERAAAMPAPAAVGDRRCGNGPLAVVDVEDGTAFAYCIGGLVLDVPAASLPALVEWTLTEAKLGQPKLSGPGKDADPLIVLTEAALERYGLPTRLSDAERLSGRLPEGHKAVKQLVRAEWKLTRRGFGPWARIYRPAEGGRRQCVQLCIPSWGALDTRHWLDAAVLPRLTSRGSWAPTRCG